MLPAHSIASLLAAAMREKGWGQLDLARASGVVQSVINGLLHADPIAPNQRDSLRRLRTLRALAEALDKPTFYFEQAGQGRPITGTGTAAFCREVKSRRLMKGWTQRKLAEEVGCTQGQVSRLERLQWDPPPEVRERLIQCLEMGRPVSTIRPKKEGSTS